MPQPIDISSKTAGVLYSVAGQGHFNKASELASAYANAVNTWTMVEVSILSAFVSMLGGPEETASTIFISLESQSAKFQAINAIAPKVLSARNQDLLSAILAVTKAHQKTRNKLVHWTAGSSFDHPGCLVLIDPRKFVQEGQTLQHAYVYNKDELDKVAKNNGKVSMHWSHFDRMISKHPAFEPSELYDKICGDSEIRETLDRQTSQG